MKGFTFIELLVIVAICAMIAIVIFYPDWQCESKATAMMKRAYKFSRAAGCMIEYKPGEWLPLENIRGVP